MRTLLLLSVLVSSSSALAAPGVFTQQGRLLDSAGTALEGNHTLSFVLYDAPAGGQIVWSEEQSTDFSNGYYAVELGRDTPFEAADFASSDELYVGLSLDGGAELSDRTPLTSVPWALSAGSVSGGSVDALSVAVGGNIIIETDGTIDYSHIVGGPEGIDVLGCSDGQVVAFSGGTASCADPVTSDALIEAVTDHTAEASAHHERFTDGDAVAAMGANDTGNALNHDRYANSEAVAAMGTKGADNALNHDRYANSEAVSAMGTKGADNALNHDRYANSEAVSAMGTKGADNALNHDRYSDSEAVGAIAADGRYATVAWSASDTKGDWVSCSSGNTVSSGKVVMNKVDVNIGNAYNPANGEVTAPADGAYMLCMNFLGGGASDDYINFRTFVNGTFANNNGNDHFLYDTNDYVAHHFYSACQLIEVNEGDKIQIQAYGCSGVYEDTDNNHERYYGFRL